MMADFISGIHNYCDRWCERCALTSHCRVADAESDLTDEERDINNEASWRRIAANFAEAKIMLMENAEEFAKIIHKIFKLQNCVE